MQNGRHQRFWMWLIIAVSLGLLPPVGRAQDPNQQDNPPQQNPPPDKTAQEQPPTPPAAPGSPAATGPNPLDTQIHPAGQAVPWFGGASPLRWGDFSIANFSYNYVIDHFQPFDGEPSEDLDLQILRTSLVFEHYFGKQHILLQYNPQLAVLNGKVAGNAGMDNEVALGTTFQLTPRFTFIFKDAFAQLHSRQLYPPDYLAVDQEGGNLIQNNFLQNAGSYLANTVTGVGVYQWSPRDTLTFSSAFKYAHATNDNDINNQVPVQTGYDISESVAYTHRLSLRQTVGAIYTFELLRETQNVAVPGNTLFHTIAGFYALQLAETWAIRGEFGGNFTRYPNNTPPLNTLAGGASIVKNFKNDLGNFALAYTRGRTENNFITAHTGDLIQAAYSQHFFKRLVWNSGAGYYRETGADPRDFGKTLDSSLAYEFIPNFFLSGQYAYLFQKATVADLLSGKRNTIILGLKWEPHRLPAH
jgi:hypothetical protein